MTLARPRATTARAARRAPADLSFTLDEATVEALAAGEPDWLAADRRAALELFTSLPSEGNQLYTPYIDLRGAALEDVRLYDEPADAPDPAAAATLPDGIAGLADLREDRVEALLIDDASRAAGVRLETLGGLLASDPDAARRLLGDSSALPRDRSLRPADARGLEPGSRDSRARGRPPPAPDRRPLVRGRTRPRPPDPDDRRAR